jgi:hypothetical protein
MGCSPNTKSGDDEFGVATPTGQKTDPRGHHVEAKKNRKDLRN